MRAIVEGLSQVKVRIITAAVFCEVFLQYMFLFCFVYSFSSFMQFTFDVCLLFFSIFNHHTDVFVYFFIYSLTYSDNKNLDFITHLFIYYLFVNLHSL